MSRQPLIFKLVDEPSEPADVSRDGELSKVAPPTPAATESQETSPGPTPLTSASAVADSAAGTTPTPSSVTSAASGDRPASTSSPVTASVVASELPPSLRARASSLGLDAFSTERDIRFKTHPPAAGRRPIGLVIGVASCAALALAALGYGAWFRGGGTPTETASQTQATGDAQFDSQPGGATVVIDGAVRGTTPLKLTLPVGPHTLEFRRDSATRTLPLAIQAGVLVSQYVELRAPAAAPTTAAAAIGRLDVSSDPPGAQVVVDGQVRGVTPLTLERVEPREHRIALSRDGSTIYRTVRVTPGATASVMASLAVPVATTGAVGGFLSLAVPFEMQVFEGDKLIGSSRTERLMMPTGRHDLELVNTALQFRAPLTVTIEAGKVAAPPVAIPSGTLSINALPWADVFIDGRSVGTTPLANLSVPIGTHEIVWRHPQLGERRQPVTVTTQGPARTGVNFSQ